LRSAAAGRSPPAWVASRPGTAVTVWLDGRELASLNALPQFSREARYGLRRGFAGLENIARITFPQAVRVVAQSGPALGACVTDRMEMTWTGPNPPSAVRLPSGERLTLEPVTGSDHAGGIVRAVLPGRIWQNGQPELRLIAQNDELRSSLRLERADLLMRLERLSQDGWLLLDELAPLQALEHAHAANMLDELSDGCRSALAGAARLYRLGKYCPPVAKSSPAPTTAKPDPVAELRTRFEALPDAARSIFTLDRLLRDSDLSPDQMGHLLLSQCEWACTGNDPIALFALAQKLGAKLPAPHTPYTASTLLPWFWMNHDWPGLHAALGCIRNAQGKWFVTAPLGWTLRALVTDLPGPRGHASAGPRGNITVAILRLIRAMAPEPGSLMRCAYLQGFVIDSIAQRHRLPFSDQKTVLRLALETYGLVPEFWDEITRLPADRLPPDWADWRSLANALRNGLYGPALHDALAQFERSWVVGSEAHRRCLIGKGGLPQPDLPAPGSLPLGTRQEAALRWLSFPRALTDAAPPPEVQLLAQQGLRIARRHTPRPQADAQLRQLGESALAAIAQLREGVLPPKLDTLRDQAVSLLNHETWFRGGAVLLAMAEALTSAGHCAAATQMLDSLQDGLAHRKQAEYLGGPALRHASARFAAMCSDAELRARAAAILPPDPVLAAPACALRSAANPLTDTLVMVVSCQPYLNTRIPDIRAAWGDLLDQAGLPMVVVVGGGDGPARLENGILTLPVPDSYEGLPQKTLAMTEWALQETGFSRVLKIDDDCFLDPHAFFADLTAIGVHYYGRPLRRARGEMDRAWHMARASSVRGRTELDKSPEPAIYADGGAGYLLSRDALRALHAARATPEGRALEAVSFMEDKLIGDLLALRGIGVSGENYDISIFRRSAPDLPPLPQYENGYLPFQGSGLKVAHLDAGGDQHLARAALSSPWPVPRKVWPPHDPATLGKASNTLDLVSPVDRLEQAQHAELAVIAVMRNERFMLKHFLAHYRALGVGAFLVADNGSDDGTLEHLAAQPDVAVFSADTPYSESRYGVLWQEALLANFRVGRWSLVADADEFLFWSMPSADGRVSGDLPALLRGADYRDTDLVRLSMLDVYPSGPLADARFIHGPFADATHIDRTPLRTENTMRGPWGNCDSVTSNLRHRLMEQMGQPAARNLFVAQKFALMRYQPWMQFSAGLHYAVGGKVATRALGFAHFKYNSEFYTKAQAEVARGQHFNSAEEYRKYLALLSEGRDTLFDPDVSVPLADCPFVQDLTAIR